MAVTSRKSKPAANARSDRSHEILEAAFTEFSTKGFDGASMETIARRAQASKETLYAWFGNKEKMFDTLVQSRIDGFSARYLPDLFGSDPAPEKVLEAIAGDVLRFMLAIEPLSRAMGAAGKNAAKARRNAGRLIASEREKFAALLLQWRKQGLVAFDDDPNEIISLFMAMAQGEWSFRLATGMVNRLTEEMIEAHARRATHVFLKGLAPRTKRR